MKNKIIKELCVGSIEDVKNKIDKLNIIDRFETCSHLEVGGLTPSVELFEYIKKVSDNKQQVVMIRNKNTFLIEDQNDLIQMQNSIDQFIKLGANEFIFGYINNQNEIDIDSCNILINHIKKYQNISYCFHMAIDQTNDYVKSFNTLIELGFKRVLLKGGKDNAINNLTILKKLSGMFRNKIEIIVGGSVTENNYNEIVLNTNINQVHGRKIV